MSVGIPTTSITDEWRVRLNSMTVAEKLEAMEIIWHALAKNAEDIPSPDWHYELARERRKSLDEGRTQAKDWEVAKSDILNRINERQ
ncbi:Putative addiction module component [Anatilimnocola aggregata]|uniref:Addiction module component n=1 Tax=Anatilimnocola aggregata TaxID=2528021 RepID=A0A517YLV7_9BACT|nr:addiction module protein [Anatilimnocola aggregata]QDU31194.1 Putative addiction module component [Anatilimnocola aggregata]